MVNWIAIWLALISVTACLAARVEQRATQPGGVIRGVNLGGWLLTEQWITPSIYRARGIDEWTLCNNLGKSSCLSVLQNHWSSFYTRSDFEDIKSAGLNSLRIPIGYWAVDVRDYEPYVQGQYPYLIQAVNWAKELGLTVLIDLHGVPGSQNGYDHSGLIGPVLFPSNSSNVDRAVGVIRNLTSEFSQGIYGGTVQGIQLLNEPRLSDGNFTMDQLKSYYTVASQAIRQIDTRLNVTIHDAFWGPQYWSNYDPTNPSSTRPANQLTLDTHQYYAFAPLNNLPRNTILDHICNVSQLLKSNTGSTGMLPAFVGEWSLETGSPPNASSQSYADSQERRTWFRLLFEAQLAAYTPNRPGQASIGWYYWCWKTQYDIDTWSYHRGWVQGYIPSDVSNSSTYAYPTLANGCVDRNFGYTAPRYPGAASRRKAISARWSLALGIMAHLSFVSVM